MEPDRNNSTLMSHVLDKNHYMDNNRQPEKLQPTDKEYNKFKGCSLMDLCTKVST